MRQYHKIYIHQELTGFVIPRRRVQMNLPISLFVHYRDALKTTLVISFVTNGYVIIMSHSRMVNQMCSPQIITLTSERMAKLALT